MFLYLARHCCGMKLWQPAEAAGSMDYSSMGKVDQRSVEDVELRTKLAMIKADLSRVES